VLEYGTAQYGTAAECWLCTLI